LFRHHLAEFAAIALIADSTGVLAATGGSPTFLTNPTPVIIQNPTTNPAPATIVNPADIAKAEGIQHPYQVNVRCQWKGGNGCDQIDPVKAPATQRLVIEYASGLCVMDVGLQVAGVDIQTTAGGVIATHQLTVVDPVGVTRGGFPHVSFGQTVRLYVDPNTNVNIEVLSSNVSTFADCDIALSGQAIDVP